jgi:LacI family transcriptional regulator
VTPRQAATLKDVAAKAGVHPATASRALHPETRHLVAGNAAGRIRQAARELGYVPNPAAATLRTGRTGLVAVLSALPLSDPRAACALAGAETALRDAGYLTLAAACPRPGPAAARAAARRADGVIIACAGLRAPLRDTGAPVTATGDSHLLVPSAAPDLPAAAALAAGHLASLGHRLAACASAPGAPLPAALLSSAASAAGLTVPPLLRAAARADTAPEGRRCCRDLLATGLPFTAVLAGGDALAAGFLEELAAAGLPCPGAVSVTGAGDLSLAASLPVPLTTVALPWHDAGAAAAGLLLARLRDPGAPPRALRLAPALHPRGSTAPPGPGALPRTGQA